MNVGSPDALSASISNVFSLTNANEKYPQGEITKEYVQKAKDIVKKIIPLCTKDTINRKRERGNFNLLRATLNGDIEIVKLFLKHGADPKLEGKF